MLTIAERADKERAVYQTEEKQIELSPAYSAWARAFVRPKMLEVFGQRRPNEFYAIAFDAVPADTLRILSIGSGTCEHEIGIATMLRERGRRFHFDCLDLSPERGALASTLVAKAGLDPADFSFLTGDANEWTPTTTYHGVMANHSLHHLAGLEHVFATVHGCLEPDGVFASADMIGRNGHMRWPEALSVVEAIWDDLPPRLKHSRASLKVDHSYVNRDATGDTFEGIRAQDILPLLLDRFHFHSFVAEGGIAEMLFGRRFGHNYDLDKRFDADLVEKIGWMNDTLISAGVIKPTMMWAVMGKSPSPSKVHKHWTPQFCVRPVAPESQLKANRWFRRS